jgi:DNA-binding IclR family transcriptional regulator
VGPDYQVKSVERALTILKCFGPERTEIGLGEFVQITGMHKSTVFRLLMNLSRHGFIWETDSGRYSIGSEIRRLGHLWDVAGVLTRKARAILLSLHDLTGETVFLVEYLQGRAICTDRMETSKALKITAQIGSTLPLFKGASGKSIAAFLSESERAMAQKIQEEIYKEVLDFQQLMEEFMLIRQQGYVRTASEVDEGVSALAVPLLTSSGRVLGSISIAGPSFRFTDEIIETYRDKVVAQIQDVIW